MQYSSINGNGFGGYGEIVFGTKGTLILEREQEVMLFKGPSAPSTIKVSGGGRRADDGHAGQRRRRTSRPRPRASEAVSRGYAEELEHWAWCIRNPAPENRPRCHPKVAMGDAVIALTTNMAAREGRRIEFERGVVRQRQRRNPRRRQAQIVEHASTERVADELEGDLSTR